MPKVCILDSPGSAYHTMFESEGWDVLDGHLIEEEDLVCFTGGTDVDPSLYGQGLHPRSQSPDKGRDDRERKIFLECEKRGIPMVGICRGAQFLCVGNNGTLVQHVTDHAISFKHPITTDYGEFEATSSHHQMMNPFDTGHTLIGYTLSRSSTYEGATKGNVAYKIKDDVLKKDPDGSVIEPEVVFFPESNSLCHQPHPEWQNGSPYMKFFFKTIEQYLGVSA